MKSILNSYLAFASPFYRIIMLLLYPLAMIGIYGGLVFIGKPYLFIIVLVALLYIEIWSDHFIFGGIALKNGQNLEYLKTSNRGITLIQKVFICDILRKSCTIIVVLIGCYLCLHFSADNLSNVSKMQWFNLTWILISYILITFCTTILRFFELVWINTLAGYIAGILMLLLVLVIPENSITNVLLVSVSVLLSIGQIWLMTYRVRRSYYDK